MVVPETYITGHDNWYARETSTDLIYVLRAPITRTDSQGLTKVTGERLILEGWTWSFFGVAVADGIQLSWSVDPLGAATKNIFWGSVAPTINTQMQGTVTPSKIAGGASTGGIIRPDALFLTVVGTATNIDVLCWGRIESMEHTRFRDYDGVPVTS